MTLEQKAQLRRLAFLVALVAAGIAAIASAGEPPPLELVPEP
jgi:hypothetical protein